MLLDFPVWPAVEFERPPELMSVAAIESYAPEIPCELDDDATLQDALAIPGGLRVYCRRQRKRDEQAGMTAVSKPERTKQDDNST
jgi:hypothetical protein